MTIKARLLTLALGILIVITAMTGISYFRSGSALNTQLDRAGTEAVKAAADTVDEYFGKVKGIAVSAAESVRYAWLKGVADEEAEVEEMVAVLAGSTRSLGVQDIYMGLEANGKFADGNRWKEPDDYDARKRSWYRDAVSAGKTIFTDPYVDAITGKMVLSIATPVFDEGRKLLGVVAIDVDISDLSAFIAGRKILGEGYGTLLNGEGLVLANPDEDLVLKVNLASDPSIHEDLRAIAGEMVAGKQGMGHYVYKGLSKRAFYAATKAGFPLAIFFPEEVVTGIVHSLTTVLVLVGVVALMILGCAVFFLIRSITRPLQRVVALADRAGSGDLTVIREDFGISGKDELAHMADALAAMISAQRKAVSAVIDEARNITESAESLAALSEETNASVEEVKSAVEHVSELSESNSAALEETNAGVQEVSTSATTTAQSSAEGASASGKTIEVARGAVDKVNAVIDDIQIVGGKAKESVETLDILATSVNAISGFVDTITGIADQTNLLALNAAIEAARAGDAGRGFAVVADEVRKLAEESNKAAQEVGALISTLQDGARNAMTVTDEAGEIMQKTIAGAGEAQADLDVALQEIVRINDVMQDIAAGAQEQAAAAEQMAAGIDQVSAATVQVVEMVANVRGNSEETAKASEGVAGHAQNLAEGAERMQGHLAQFKVKG